jgi:hypothetical protein
VCVRRARGQSRIASVVAVARVSVGFVDVHHGFGGRALVGSFMGARARVSLGRTRVHVGRGTRSIRIVKMDPRARIVPRGLQSVRSAALGAHTNVLNVYSLNAVHIGAAHGTSINARGTRDANAHVKTRNDRVVFGICKANATQVAVVSDARRRRGTSHAIAESCKPSLRSYWVGQQVQSFGFASDGLFHSPPREHVAFGEKSRCDQVHQGHQPWYRNHFNVFGT